ncbi:MAG: exosortase [Blastopirellula sp.]|nr:MAG: exosortase [Blastopirellula sp.]
MSKTANQNRRKAKNVSATTKEQKPDSGSNEPDSISKFYIFAVALALSCLFFWAYLPTLIELVEAWEREPDYSHGYLIPPLALAFLWFRRDRFPEGPLTLGVSDFVFGGSLILFSILVRYFAAIYFLGSVDAWSILPWLAGAVWMLGGRKILYFALPSISFLFFMIPLPFRAESMLSLPLQGIAARLSAIGLQCLGQPAIREGNLIFLGENILSVEEACSGLRIFVAIIALAFAYVILTKRSWWEKLILIASVGPIALAANSLRIIATGLLYQYASGEAAHKFSHDLAGFIMIPLAAAMFGMVLWYLGKLFMEVQQVQISSLVSEARKDL